MCCDILTQGVALGYYAAPLQGESADAIFARASEVFVADKLSDTNKKQAKELKIKWVELRFPNLLALSRHICDNKIFRGW